MRDWNLQRWNWKRAVKKDPRLSDAAKLLAVSLCDDFAHHETARCTPHVGTLAECLGKSERSIQRALAELRKLRWIDVKHRRGRGARSEIYFESGDGTVPVSCPEKVTDMSRKGDNGVTPYMEPNINQNAQARADATPTATNPPHQCSAAGAAMPPAPASRPALHLQEFVPLGSDAAADWEQWLRRRKWASLLTLAELVRVDGTECFDLPFKRPPSEDARTPTMIAERFFAFRMEQTRAKHRHDGTHASHSAVG